MPRMRWGGRPPAVPVSGEFTRGGPSGREEVIGVGLRNADGSGSTNTGGPRGAQGLQQSLHYTSHRAQLIHVNIFCCIFIFRGPYNDNRRA